MKKLLSLKSFNDYQGYIVALILLIVNILFSTRTFAQTIVEKADTDINSNGGVTVWFGQPWLWAIGVAIFILVIIAITHSKNNNNA